MMRVRRSIFKFHSYWYNIIMRIILLLSLLCLFNANFFQLNQILQSDTTVVGGTISYDQNIILTVNQDFSVYIWNKIQGTYQYTSTLNHSNLVRVYIISEDNSTIVTCEDSISRIWVLNGTTYNLNQTINFNTSKILSASLSQNKSKLVFLLNSPSEMRVFVLNSTEYVQVQKQTNAGYILRLIMSSDSSVIITSSKDIFVWYWNGKVYYLSHTLKNHTNYVTDLALTRDCNTLFSVSYDYTLKIWSRNSTLYTLSQSLPTSYQGIGISATDDGKMVTVALANLSIGLWWNNAGSYISLDNPIKTNGMTGFSSLTKSNLLSNDGMVLVTFGISNISTVYHNIYRSYGKTLKLNTASSGNIAFSADGTLLISGSVISTKLWSVNDGQIQSMSEIPENASNSFYGLSSDKSIILEYKISNRFASVYQVSSLNYTISLLTVLNVSNPISVAAISSDASCIVIGSSSSATIEVFKKNLKGIYTLSQRLIHNVNVDGSIVSILVSADCTKIISLDGGKSVLGKTFIVWKYNLNFTVFQTIKGVNSYQPMVWGKSQQSFAIANMTIISVWRLLNGLYILTDQHKTGIQFAAFTIGQKSDRLYECDSNVVNVMSYDSISKTYAVDMNFTSSCTKNIRSISMDASEDNISVLCDDGFGGIYRYYDLSQ